MKLNKLLEWLVKHLIPPSMRDEILGDLHERCRSSFQYLIEVVKLLPAIALIQARSKENMTTKQKLAIAIGVALLLAAIAFNSPPHDDARPTILNAVPFLVLLLIWVILMVRKLKPRPPTR